MANFTMSCSFAYTKGVTLEGFKRTLCGPATPLAAGDVMIKSAYTYLSQGVTKDQIIKTNDGKAVAGAFQFFLDQHNRGVYSDGTEIFGSREILAKSTVAREGGCRWYQFWCHVEVFANWVVANWEVIQQILVFVLNL
ncbi:MAG: hypothetical protein ABIO04_12810, partial [Ferruginibacter sp.]